MWTFVNPPVAQVRDTYGAPVEEAGYADSCARDARCCVDLDTRRQRHGTLADLTLSTLAGKT